MDLDIISEILAKIEITLAMFPNHNIIWGGDFNTNLLLGNTACLLINKFLCNYNLEVVKSSVSLNVNICNFTYQHDTQQVQSYIDYFIINKNLMDSLLDFDIIDWGSNLSDHNPIVLKVSCIGLKLQSTVQTKCATVNEPVQYTLRWDHTNTKEFYHRTYIDCGHVANKLEEVYEDLIRWDSNGYISGQMASVFC